MIAVLDFGSQFTHLINRRLRQLGVKSQIFDHDTSSELLKKQNISGIILSGGPSSVYEKGAPLVDKKVFNLGIPILGVCYGWQMMAKLLGGEVKNTAKEYGPEMITINKGNKIPGVLQGLPKSEFQVFVSHGDSVIKLPPGFETIASTRNVKYTAVQNGQVKLYGIQFHPEVKHTEYGLEILRNFALICQEEMNPLSLDPQKIIDEIKLKVGGNKIIAAVSGGVDSTVAAFLMAKAVGKNLIPVYVESGLMREGTDKHVAYIFSKLVKSNLIIVDARKRFLKALKGVTDPEQKRKLIGGSPPTL